MISRIKFLITSLVMIFALSVLLQIDGKAQVELEVKITLSKSGPGKLADITVEILRGMPKFTYYLYDKLPWEDGEIIQSSKSINKYSYTFKRVAQGSYHVFVTDDEGKGASKLVTVNIPDLTESAFQDGLIEFSAKPEVYLARKE